MSPLRARLHSRRWSHYSTLRIPHFVWSHFVNIVAQEAFVLVLFLLQLQHEFS